MATQASAATNASTDGPSTSRRAATDNGHSSAARALATDPQPHKVILGPDGLPNDPYIGGYNGWAGITTTLYIEKLKLAIRIPQIVAAVYAFGSDTVGPQPAPAFSLPTRPKPNCGYFTGYTPGNVYIADVDQPDKSKPGRVRSIGVLPDTRVHALLFGSVPVSAILHIRQAGRPGQLTPITARQFANPDTWTKPYNPASGDPSDGYTHCDDEWAQNLPNVVVARGSLVASLSDVEIDGKPVDVGTSCTTTAPTELLANGNTAEFGGSYQGILGGGPLVQQLNRTTSKGDDRVKLYPGAINLTIAPFTGCRDAAGRQDLSHLISTFISGSDNTASLYQGVPILNNTPGTNVTDICGSDGSGTDRRICADDPLPYVDPVAPGR